MYNYLIVFLFFLIPNVGSSDTAIQQGNFTVLKGSLRGPTSELYKYFHTLCFDPPYSTDADCFEREHNDFLIPGPNYFFRLSNEFDYTVGIYNRDGFTWTLNGIEIYGDEAEIFGSILAQSGAKVSNYPRPGVRSEVLTSFITCTYFMELTSFCLLADFF